MAHEHREGRELWAAGSLAVLYTEDRNWSLLRRHHVLSGSKTVV